MVEPNDAHRALVDLEQWYDVYVITQNVDDLHERAGSKNIIHLHGELMNVAAMDDRSLCWRLNDYTVRTTPETEIEGHKVRPDIVFFQEAVPMIEPAAQLASEADIFVVIGTTLVVYPAAGLLQCVRPGTPVYYIDPKPAHVPPFVNVIAEPATKGVAKLVDLLRPKED